MAGRAPPSPTVEPPRRRDGTAVSPRITTNPTPAGPTRVGWWDGPGAGTVLFVPGRGDSIELRAPVADGLAERGFSTVVVEHVGQGGSGRLGRHPDAVHVDDFAVHLDAVDRVVDAVVPSARGPLYLLGHSMGGLLAGHLLVRHPGRFAAAVLTAPFWGFAGPLPLPAVRALSAAATAAGLGRELALGERPWDLESCLTMRTTDAAGRAALTEFARGHRELVRGGSTWAWTGAAARSMAALRRLPLERVATPVVSVAARRDRSVSLPAIPRITARFPRGRVLVVDGGHDVLNEGEEVRRAVWAGIDAAFRPGTAAA